MVFPAQEHAIQETLVADKAKGLDVSSFTTEATTPGDTFLYPLTDHAPEINDIMNKTFDSIFLGYVSAQSAMTDANAKVNALFK